MILLYVGTTELVGGGYECAEILSTRSHTSLTLSGMGFGRFTEKLLGTPEVRSFERTMYRQTRPWFSITQDRHISGSRVQVRFGWLVEVLGVRP